MVIELNPSKALPYSKETIQKPTKNVEQGSWSTMPTIKSGSRGPSQPLQVIESCVVIALKTLI